MVTAKYISTSRSVNPSHQTRSLTNLPIEAVIFDLDGTLANFNLDFKTLRGEVRSYLIRSGIPTSLLSVNENIFQMLTKTEIFFKHNGKSAGVFEAVRGQALAIAEKYELEAAATTSLLPGQLKL